MQFISQAKHRGQTDVTSGGAPQRFHGAYASQPYKRRTTSAEPPDLFFPPLPLFFGIAFDALANMDTAQGRAAPASVPTT